ncbi:hypothetical protein CY34DRAFT_653860 [Suillus luteus UH-Slu-Lm8-n1]|uniref:Uncharacterized protein n=1 Tax=Suillus luteus UH-Slu-Lm8-n1 TaxID=930992 RepID=A0A0D0BLE8_9AGAM|nr:hypothetical protein CY34DRAFT_653860 [Suillus luteus UH-Slu-Lm8-n1]
MSSPSLSSLLGRICYQSRNRLSHAPPAPTPHQRFLGRFTSVWRRDKPHGATEPATQSQSRPFSWTQNLSGMLRRRDQSDIQLQEVEVPYTAGKPVHCSLIHSSSVSLSPRTEELPRRKEEANCQLISTFQYSYHATTQRSSTKHIIIITATASNYYYLNALCRPWYYWGDGNSFPSSYRRFWMAR